VVVQVSDWENTRLVNVRKNTLSFQVCLHNQNCDPCRARMEDLEKLLLRRGFEEGWWTRSGNVQTWFNFPLPQRERKNLVGYISRIIGLRVRIVQKVTAK